MSRRALSFLIFVLLVALAAAVFSSERGVSGVMEKIGDLISRFVS
jgi:hypothetical protein